MIKEFGLTFTVDYFAKFCSHLPRERYSLLPFSKNGAVKTPVMHSVNVTRVTLYSAHPFGHLLPHDHPQPATLDMPDA